MKTKFRVVVLDYTSGVVGVHDFDHELSGEELNSLLDEKYHKKDIYYMCGENISINYE